MAFPCQGKKRHTNTKDGEENGFLRVTDRNPGNLIDSYCLRSSLQLKLLSLAIYHKRTPNEMELTLFAHALSKLFTMSTSTG